MRTIGYPASRADLGEDRRIQQQARPDAPSRPSSPYEMMTWRMPLVHAM